MKPRGLVAVLLLFALALSACGGTGIREASSEPIAPDAPVLLIRLDGGDDRYGVSRHVADYLSDGTVIRWANPGPACEPGRPCGRLERNTLTAAGLATFRALLADDVDLLAQPSVIESKQLPNKAGSRPVGDIINIFVLEQPDGSRYTVRAPSARSANAATWVPDPAIERLHTLAEAMMDPLALVGSAGLVNPAWEPYRPAKMAVFVRHGRMTPKATPMVDKDGKVIGGPLSPLEIPELGQDWPFESEPDTIGTAFTGPDGRAWRCVLVSSADVETVIASLSSGGGDGSFAADTLAEGGRWDSGARMWGADMYVALGIVALLPEDGAASCLDAMSY